MSSPPSPVELYFRGIQNSLSTNPLVINYSVRRRRVGDSEGFIVIDIDLIRSYRLTIMEYFTVSANVIRYRYHLMDNDNNPVIRWDNAPHHPDISTFPHHVHYWDSDGAERIEKAEQPEINGIFDRIEEDWNLEDDQEDDTENDKSDDIEEDT